MRFLIIALFMMATFASFSQNNLKQTNLLKHLLGCWTVKSFQYLPVSAINEKEANNLLNKNICLQHRKAIIFDVEASLPTYNFSIIRSNSYLHNEYGVTKTELGIISDSLIMINIKSSASPGLFPAQEIILDHNKMYFFKDGAMFILNKRLKSYR